MLSLGRRWPRAVSQPPGGWPPSSTARLDDVDSLYESVREAGGDIALEITDTDYGSRDFTVRDPEGNLWAFGTYRPGTGED